jgi:excisionase family DNA binding protein
MQTAIRQRSEDRHAPFTVEAPGPALAERAAALARMLDLFRDAYEALPAARAETTQACALIGPNDERIPLPAAFYEVLRTTAEILAAGGSVTIVPVEKELTTQEAADMLNMSRQYLVRLLDADAIPYHRVNSHRRIRLQDLLAFKAQRDSDRRDALRNLTRITEEAGTPDAFPDQEAE